MTKKEFLTKWRYSKQHPLQFYRPVEEEVKDEPFTIEIEYIEEQTIQIEFYFEIQTMFNLTRYLESAFSAPRYSYAYDQADVQPWYAYQKNSFFQGVFLIINPTYDGVLITPQNFPDLFRQDIDFETLTYEKLIEKGGILAHPVIHKTTNINGEVVIEQFSKQLTIYADNLNSTIYWGDGEKEEIVPNVVEKSIKVKINNKIVEIKYQTITSSILKSHKYSSTKRYIIRINSNCLITTPYFYRSNVRKILSWGKNNNIRSLGYIYTYDINDRIESIPEDCSSLHNVINAHNFFNYMIYNFTLLSKEEWQKRVVNMLHSMPYLINASSMFSGGSIYDSNSHTDLNYIFFNDIPSKLFCQNKYLITADYCFYGPFNKSIQSVGDQVFANLPFLTSAYSSFYSNYIYDEADDAVKTITDTNIIGNSVFENDWLLHSVGMAFFGIYVKKYGDYIFKNCHSLTLVSHMGYNMLPLRTLGKGIFENCYNLKYIHELCLDCPLLEDVGENIFKGCKNLILLKESFRGIDSLTKLPEKMFYDLECVEGRKYGFHFSGLSNFIGPVFDENGQITEQSGHYNTNWFQEIVKKWNFYTIPTVFLPKDFINPEFIENCNKQNLNITLSFYNSHLRYQNKAGTWTERPYLRGYAPDCWNYDNYGVFQSLTNPNNTITQPSENIYAYYSLYGYKRQSDNDYICENNWVNYDEIPKEYLRTYGSN